MPQRGNESRIAASTVARAAPFARRRACGKIAIQRFARGRIEGITERCEPTRQAFEIAPVTRECVVGQTVLGPDAFDKRIDRGAINLVDWCIGFDGHSLLLVIPAWNA